MVIETSRGAMNKCSLIEYPERLCVEENGSQLSTYMRDMHSIAKARPNHNRVLQPFGKPATAGCPVGRDHHELSEEGETFAFVNSIFGFFNVRLSATISPHFLLYIPSFPLPFLSHFHMRAANCPAWPSSNRRRGPLTPHLSTG